MGADASVVAAVEVMPLNLAPLMAHSNQLGHGKRYRIAGPAGWYSCTVRLLFPGRLVASKPPAHVATPDRRHSILIVVRLGGGDSNSDNVVQRRPGDERRFRK